MAETRCGGVGVVRRAIAVLGMLLLASAGARPLHSQAPDSLTARMARALTEEGLVGVAWSLVTPDSVTIGAAGIRDLGRNTPMRADNRVQVGSVAKTIIATGVLVLATEGRVDLDAPVAHYLPRLPIDNPWQADAPLLVRHLLDHTGGLADVHLWQVFTMRGDPDSPLRSALGPDGSVVQVRTRPGSRFSYSNVGYLILGLVIEEVTGKRYEQWIDESLLAPIGMHQSTTAFVSQEGPAADTLLAMGHFEGGIPAASFAVPVRPASQFTTTAADMALLARFLMSDGVVDGRTLVDSTLLAAMAVPFTTRPFRPESHRDTPSACSGGSDGASPASAIWEISGPFGRFSASILSSSAPSSPHTTSIPRAPTSTDSTLCSPRRSAYPRPLRFPWRRPASIRRSGAVGTCPPRTALHSSPISMKLPLSPG
ncbi:MAG: serine hydrolase domain-containing protein [Gemmatimonadales bacterium]|nr:serine hydrolase domain-containing protein [Gemmatimonadales bacterium]